MGKVSIGNTAAFETFNGNVNGFILNPQTQIGFVASAVNSSTSVNHIG